MNRASKYGDGLFETIRVVNREVQQLERHFLRLSKGLTILQMQAADTPLTLSHFQKIITDFISTQSDANLRIRITFFRKDGGLYTPQQNDYNYVIEATKLRHPSFELNTKGLHLGIAQKVRLPIDELSNLKTISALPYVLAALEKQNKAWDDCLILNAKDRLAESIAANVFVVKAGQIYTPSLQEGCVMGVMRAHVIEQLQGVGKIVFEQAIPLDFLKDADEVFLTNAIRGLQWIESIEGIKDKLGSETCREILAQL